MFKKNDQSTGILFRRGKAVLPPLLAAGIVFCVSWSYIGTVSAPLSYPHFAQMVMIYPAVFFAAGHGMGTTDVSAIPELEAFIYQEQNALDIEVIPEDVEIRPLESPLALSALYFLYTVGWMWRIFGVSEQTLLLYAVLLRALCAALLYGLFRFGLGRIGSFTAALLVCLSPAMLSMDISIRDWGPAPFVFAFLLIIAHATLRPVSRTRLLLLSGGLGLLFGIGMGFRQDLLAFIPLAFGALCLFARVRAHCPLPWRIAAALLFLLVFIPVSRPIFQGTALEGDQETSVNTIYRGMSPKLHREMRFGGSGVDLLPESFSGEAVNYAAINVYARRTGNHESMVNPISSEYKRFMGDADTHLFIDPYLFYNGTAYANAGRQLLYESAGLFVADFVARAWRSVIAVFQGPRHYSERALVENGARPGWLHGLLIIQDGLARHIERFALVYIVLVLLVLAARDLRLALLVAGFFLWLTGYPSLKFEYRHFFYLMFIPVWAMALCIEHALGWLKGRLQGVGRNAWREIRPMALNWLVLCLVLVLAYSIPLYAMRTWQCGQIMKLADRFLSATHEPVSLHIEHNDSLAHVSPASVLPGLSASETLPPGETAWEYIALVFDTHGHDIPLTVHYDDTRIIKNFTETLTIYGVDDNRTGRVTFFCPLYEIDTVYCTDMLEEFLRTYPALNAMIDDPRPLPEQDWWRRSRFVGISFPAEYLALFAGWYVVRDIDDVPVLPLLQAPEDRQHMRCWKMGPWERKVRAFISDAFSGVREEPHAPIDHDCWALDEPLLYHPPSSVFQRLLLHAEHPEAYIEQWRKRTAWLPALAEAAAMDLANAGTVWLNQGRIEAAIEAYRLACALDDHTALYPVRLGQLLLRVDDAEGALEQFARGLRLQPVLPETAEQLDALFGALDDRPGQIAFWRELFDVHPDAWFTGMRLGMLLEADARYQEAASVYARVHERHPDHPDTRLALARCWTLIGNLPEALRLVEDTVALHPDTGRVASVQLTALSHRFFELEDWASAQRTAALAANCDPKNPMAWLQLGVVQQQDKQLQAARSSYEAALALAQGEYASLAPTIRDHIHALGQRTLDETP